MNLRPITSMITGLFIMTVLGISIEVKANTTETAQKTNTLSTGSSTSPTLLTVYKSPSCGCCKQWMSHLDNADFKTVANHPESLDSIKARYHIAPNLRSCHTAVSEGNYVFEGHIPARYIRQFLASPPGGAIGLTVPAMPLGSPGMEVGNRFMPYQVLLLKQDGGTEVFAEVETSEQQYQKQ